MTNQYTSDITESNNRALNRLARAIALSQGQFSLILACCNDGDLRKQMVKKLKELSEIESQEIFLLPSVKTLLTTILKKIENKQPHSLMVFGLESVVAINQLLSSTNLVRDEFSKQLNFPLVLWVSDNILKDLIRSAPDFKSFAINAIRFDPANAEVRAS